MPNGSNSAAMRASGRTKRGQHSQSIEPSRPTKAAYLQSNLLGNERARVLGTRANLRAKEKVELTVRLAKSRCEQALEALGWHATRTPDRRQDYFPKNELPANVPPERSVPGSARMCLDVWYCEGFRTPAVTNVSPRTTAGVRKPPRDETAGRGTYWAVPRAQLWGFGRGRATTEVGSEGRLSCGDDVAGRVRDVVVICGPVRR
jgi:hypothetical protein